MIQFKQHNLKPEMQNLQPPGREGVLVVNMLAGRKL